MELLASCNLERSKSFTGKLSLPNEDAKSPDKVFLNVVITEEDAVSTVFQSLSGNEKCVTFRGVKPTFCPTEWEGRVFYELDMESLGNCGLCDVKGVVNLVTLSENYANMRTIKSICEAQPSVRFIGGNLLQIDGVRIGRFDKGKDKGSPVYKDVYDTFVEVNLDDLSGIQEIVKKTRAKVTKQEKEKKERVKKAPQEKKLAKRQLAFANMFGGSEDEF